MKRNLFYIVIFLIAGWVIVGCIKPFSPAVTTVNANILVVEGFINTGGDTTKIKLSHTVTIGSKTTSVPETGAVVTVENAAGVVYPVPETTVKGMYASKGALALTSGMQYRLRIKTTGGKTYLSDLVDAKAVPPIDSLGYNFTSFGINFYVNSHDPNNQTLYYKYGFSETWRFSARYESGFISNGKVAVARSLAHVSNNFYCFGTDSSNNILLNSTAALGKDVVSRFSVNTQSDTLEKFEIRYSMLLSQQALTKDGYTFWQNLKQNTEQLGSIFDAQPSSISGNIHNINNPAEPVIGFISAGTIQRKRIYINRSDLPANFIPGYPATCQILSAADVDSLIAPKIQPPYWAWPFVIQLPSPNRIITAADPAGPFTFTSAICADCTLRGTTTQPSFWKP